MTKEEALARLAESRRALHQAIEGLSEEKMTQIQVEGVWTIKDVLGHITSWEETCLELLRRYADGGPFEVKVIEDYLTWNAALLRHRTSRPPACAATVAQTRHPAGCHSRGIGHHPPGDGTSGQQAVGQAVGAEGALLVGRRRDNRSM